MNFELQIQLAVSSRAVSPGLKKKIGLTELPGYSSLCAKILQFTWAGLYGETEFTVTHVSLCKEIT